MTQQRSTTIPSAPFVAFKLADACVAAMVACKGSCLNLAVLRGVNASWGLPARYAAGTVEASLA